MIFLVFLFLSCLSQSLSSSRDLEVLDPRHRSPPFNSEPGTEGSDGDWSFIDMHWLSHSSTLVEGVGEAVAEVEMDLGYSEAKWALTEDYCGYGEDNSQRRRCVNVEYSVDRVGKVFLMDEVRSLEDRGYVVGIVGEVCKIEGLREGECEHLRTIVVDGVEQRRAWVEGGSVWSDAHMEIMVCGKVFGTWRWPYVKAIEIGRSEVEGKCQGSELEGWDVKVEVRMSGKVPGYNPGKRFGTETSSVSSFFYTTEECTRTCDGVRVKKPYEGGMVRRRFEVEVEGVGVRWSVEGEGGGGGEGSYWAVVERGRGGRRAVIARKVGCRCDRKEFEIVEDYKLETFQEGGQRLNFVYHGVDFNGLGREEEIRRRAEEVGVVETEFGVEEEVGTGGEGEGRSGGRWVRIEVLTLIEGEEDNLTVVTACSQEYVDDGRLGNLIGSLLFWEPTVEIIFYDLGVESWVHKKLSGLGVTVLGLPESYEVGGEGGGVVVETKPHFHDASTYAFKALCIWDALRGNGKRRVLWVDAGAEVRRRLDGVRERMKDDGWFLIKHEGGFPDGRYHREETIAKLGCEGAGEGTMPHCATTFVGVVGGGYMEKIVGDVLGCSEDMECINPKGSHRGNHRQEQTAMNALFCRDERMAMCDKDIRGRWSGSTEFANDRKEGGRVERDKREWNDVELYTRRVHPVKPYQVF